MPTSIQSPPAASLLVLLICRQDTQRAQTRCSNPKTTNPELCACKRGKDRQSLFEIAALPVRRARAVVRAREDRQIHFASSLRKFAQANHVPNFRSRRSIYLDSILRFPRRDTLSSR